MTHRFNITSPLSGLTLREARQCIGVPDFHEEISRKLPGTHLNILESVGESHRYRLKKELNLDVNLPDIAKKLLKDAFRISRLEEWDTATLTSSSRYSMNLPAEFRCKMSLLEENGQLMAKQDWEVNVNVPLLSGVLARHAEGEIRRFSQIEIEVMQRELTARVSKGLAA